MVKDPITTCNEELSNANVEDVMQAIVRLEKAMNLEKLRFEDPANASEYDKDVTPVERIDWYRKYLQQARKIAIEKGAELEVSEELQKVIDFNNDIDEIDMIMYQRGTIQDNVVIRASYDLGVLTIDRVHKVDGDDKEASSKEYKEELKDVVDRFKELYLGEWEDHYVLDEESEPIEEWNVTISYKDGREEVLFEGADRYPYNFEAFASLMGDDSFKMHASKR